jgi:hypothetical protein
MTQIPRPASALLVRAGQPAPNMFWKYRMTDPTHLNELITALSHPLSRKLVETFRDSSRDPSVARADYVQRLKNEMEAALQESPADAATQSNNP